MSQQVKLNILLATIGAVLITLYFVEPIAQDPRYHRFADQRTIAGIANFWNVVSSGAFLIAGLYGLVSCHVIRITLIPHGLIIPITLFFSGLVLTGLGSAYYHLQPGNMTLVWDRLAMVIAFVPLFIFVLNRHINEAVARRLLWPLMLVGIFSVIYWGYTESLGRGDLRLYGLVQFLPGLLIPLILLMFPTTNYRSSTTWGILGLYVIAKLAEHFDHQLFDSLLISGHTLKHLFAAVAGLIFLRAVKGIKGQQ